MVRHGKDGMDEVSLGASTLVGELKDGAIREYEIRPEDFGLRMASNRSLRGRRRRVEGRGAFALDNLPGTALEIVVFNAGVALYVANSAESIGRASRAREALASGAARAKLDEFARFTQGCTA